MSTFSPAFLAAAKQSYRSPLVLLRLPILLIALPFALLAAVCKGLAAVGDWLEDLVDGWRHEAFCWATPAVWDELLALKARAEKAEQDAANMRWVCNAHEDTIARAKEIVAAHGWDKDPNYKGYPVIEWPKPTVPMHQPTEQEPTL